MITRKDFVRSAAMAAGGMLLPGSAVHGVDFTCRGLDLLAAARDRHYPKA